MQIEMGRVYKTRDGREVRIYAVDGGGKYPVHGATKLNGQWLHNVWTACGGYYVGVDDHEFDLIEVKPRIKRKVWVNVYRGHEMVWMTIHDKRDEADDYPDCHNMRIACVEIDIDVEEGHGL